MPIRVLFINGVNLNLLGVREPSVYGSRTLESINRKITQFAASRSVKVDFFQSNIEGEIVNEIHKALGVYNAIVINPGAFTHYSIAIRDAISAVGLCCVEVHISNIYKREEFRHHSVIAPVCCGQISGFGEDSYILALESIMLKFSKE